MASTDSFVFYRSFRDAIKELPDEDRLAVYDAICNYALDHVDGCERPVARSMMVLIKPQLDANFRKRQNGSQGGRPKTAQSSEELEDKADNQGKNHNLDETKTKPKHNLDETKGEPNVNVNVNANANVNANVNVNANGRVKKHKHGQYMNVLLSDEEMEKLKTEFPNDYKERIERVSEYCASKGRAYKNYLATIRAWSKKDVAQKRGDIIPTYDESVNPEFNEERFNEIMKQREKK